MKNMALSRSWKGIVYSVRAETRQSITLFCLSWAPASGDSKFSVLGMTVNDCASAVKLFCGYRKLNKWVDL